MNTPAHIMVNLLCLGRSDQVNVLTPVVIGAVLPDAPMFLFYFVEKVVRRTPEHVIWTHSYHQQHWQNFIDWFNSLPLMVAGLLVTAWFGSKVGMLLFGSMVLHILGDFPLHNDDAHRHFFPFSHWRWHSPISYWDPKYFGHLVTILEILAVVLSCLILWQTYQSLPSKLTIGIVGASYLLYFVYVFIVWT